MVRIYKVICQEFELRPNQVELDYIECTVTIDEETQDISDVIRIVQDSFKVPIRFIVIVDVAAEKRLKAGDKNGDSD